MNVEHTGRKVRHYPQEAFEDIFLHLEMIEERYGVGDSESGGA